MTAKSTAFDIWEEEESSPSRRSSERREGAVRPCDADRVFEDRDGICQWIKDACRLYLAGEDPWEAGEIDNRRARYKAEHGENIE